MPGSSWVDLNATTFSPDDSRIYAVVSLGNGTFLAGGGGNGYIYRSPDHGIHWIHEGKASPNSVYVMGLANIGGGVCLASTALYGNIARSTDHGDSWNVVFDDTNELFAPFNHCWDVVYLGNGVCLAEADGNILRSTDSGVTWTNQGKYDNEGYIYCFANLGGGICLAGTNKYRILRSTNYGASWTGIDVFTYPDIRAVESIDGTICLAGDNGGHIWRSEDGGLTWTDLGEIHSAGSIYSIHHVGNGICLAGTASGGKILRSPNPSWADPGEVWDTLGQQFGLSFIHDFASENNGDVCLAGAQNGDGHILRSEMPYSPSESPSQSPSGSPSASASPSESPSISPSCPPHVEGDVGSVSGTVWEDSNGNGVRDAGEPGLYDVWVYADLNDDCLPGLLENANTTDTNGNFTIYDIPTGWQKIRVAAGSGKEVSFPTGTDHCGQGYYEVCIRKDTNVPNLDFGIKDASSPSESPSTSPSASPSESASPSTSPSESPSTSPSASSSESASPSTSPSESPSTSPSASSSESASPSTSPSASPSASPSPEAPLGYFSFFAFWMGGAGVLISAPPGYRTIEMPGFNLSGTGTFSEIGRHPSCASTMNKSLLVSMYGWGSSDISTQFSFDPCGEEVKRGTGSIRSMSSQLRRPNRKKDK